jgi:adenylate kinase
VDATDRQTTDVLDDIHTMLKLRFRNNAPKRPPQVIMIGPPGSGKTTQAQIASDAFGLVLISPQKILKEEAERNPPIKIKLQEAAEKGEPVPDEILLRLIDQRVRQSDCRINGWILDGFPQSESQVNLLKSMRVKPSLVCIFE